MDDCFWMRPIPLSCKKKTSYPSLLNFIHRSIKVNRRGCRQCPFKLSSASMFMVEYEPYWIREGAKLLQAHIHLLVGQMPLSDFLLI